MNPQKVLPTRLCARTHTIAAFTSARAFFTQLAAAFSVAIFLLTAEIATAQIIYKPIKHSEYQAINDDGSTAWPAGGVQPYPIELIGVVINNPWDMLDYSSSASSPQWQVFIQTRASDDFGGTALYMRKKTPNNTSDVYDVAGWESEMARLNYPLFGGSQVTEPLRYGDVIKVQANAPGMFFGGKYNINEKHSASPANDFYITILERDTTPQAANITLADLKDPDNSCKFDATRATGCEHYQASLVHLDNLLLADAGAWNLNGLVTIKQGDLTFTMRLGLDPNLALIDAVSLETTPFSVTAIMNQESGSGPHTAGYQLWLTSASGLMVIPEPGTLALLAAALLAALAWRRRK